VGTVSGSGPGECAEGWRGEGSGQGLACACGHVGWLGHAHSQLALARYRARRGPCTRNCQHLMTPQHGGRNSNDRDGYITADQPMPAARLCGQRSLGSWVWERCVGWRRTSGSPTATTAGGGQQACRSARRHHQSLRLARASERSAGWRRTSGWSTATTARGARRACGIAPGNPERNLRSGQASLCPRCGYDLLVGPRPHPQTGFGRAAPVAGWKTAGTRGPAW
jgi:hypothetical protein